MSQKLKTDLFRFVTLRSPKLLDADRRRLGFVSHPDPTLSHFLNPIVEETSLEEARSTVQGLTDSFTPYQTLLELKNETGDVWDFSMWLSKYARTITPAMVGTNLPGSGLSSQVVAKIWDQIYYDLLTKSNAPIRQACLQLLVAQHFIEEVGAGFPVATGRLVEGSEQERQRRLAQGKVIIHPAFTPPKQVGVIASPEQMQANFGGQEAIHQAMRTSVAASQMESIEEELENLRLTHQAEYEAAQSTAYATYTASARSIMAQYETENPNARTTATPEDTYPSELFSEFNFFFPAPLSESYTDTKLSAEAEAFLDKENLRTHSSEEAIEAVRAKIQSAKKKSSRSLQPLVREAVINGVMVRPEETAFHECTFSLEQIPTAPTGTYSIYMSLNTGKNGVFVRSLEGVVQLDGSNVTTNVFNALLLEGQVLMVELYRLAPLSVSGGTVFPISVEMELSDGRVLSVTGELNAAMPMNSAYAVNTPMLNPELPSVQHHGIKSLGVADYRKVEQELCCYVAGEVSHVENILAREYKEKSTRNLVSSESTLEISTERESEDLSDTVTTARNEMSTEVAEVINRDRRSNYGFNAGVSGDFLGQNFNASAYGDFAFGQSSSQSNAVARNYAEDVTRRALERVLQRTAVRRTSRILKEFEENTQHGFDNREGTDHVTGVYRWLDKVYKNTLVNYGKRMMYEFMVPEPARFYKKAVIVKAKEEQNSPVATDAGSTGASGVILKPTHPSEMGVQDAGDITRTNYSNIASHYGVSVSVPQNETMQLTGNYGEAIGGSGDDHSFTYNDIIVPPDYECIQIKGNVSYNYASHFYESTGILKIVAGGKNWGSGPLEGVSSGTGNFTHPTGAITGPISVNVTTRQIRQFNLGLQVKAQLKAHLYEQWQQEIFEAVMAAYSSALQAYNDAQAASNLQNQADNAAAEPAEDMTLSINPKYNAKVVLTELKRLCIEMLTQPFGIRMGADLYTNGPCDVPRIRQGQYLDYYGSTVKFFEQAFDWELMSYHFYPYYWAKRCHWVSLFQSQDSIDHIFQAFLQSGMARLVVPVREGFEDAVIFYLETGEVWQGSGMVIETDDELYLSIADEMTVAEGQVEDSWDTVVPTTLTVVQARSVLLDEEGLPCCETNPTVLAARTLKPDTSILTRDTTN